MSKILSHRRDQLLDNKIQCKYSKFLCPYTKRRSLDLSRFTQLSSNETYFKTNQTVDLLRYQPHETGQSYRPLHGYAAQNLSNDYEVKGISTDTTSAQVSDPPKRPLQAIG